MLLSNNVLTSVTNVRHENLKANWATQVLYVAVYGKDIKAHFCIMNTA